MVPLQSSTAETPNSKKVRARAPLKLLLLNITQDTEKHGKLLKNIIEILSHEQTMPSNEVFRMEVDYVSARAVRNA